MWVESSHIKDQYLNPNQDGRTICFMPSQQWSTNSLKYEPSPPLNLPVISQDEWKKFGIMAEPVKLNY